ncbi:hypothetical protein NUW58_g3624 [Xylaria curta]|uniref:Uncharacterized protein n=1 Tax=Xylaria curta TaxID=42375 RepID=A0ACC1PB32_9PEZI|nr:hypothetical protein NUW58_g3624 [Xylaria curta]
MAHELWSFPCSGRPPNVTNALPELRDADYQNEVLQSSADNHDTYLQGLAIKAQNLGISVPQSRPVPSIPENHDTMDAEANATVDPLRARTVSSRSQATASTTLTSHSSNYGHSHTSRILPIGRSLAPKFGLYESYLSHIKPSLGQSKFVTSPTVESTSSLLGMSTRESYKNLREEISKLLGRRKVAALIISCSACRDDIRPSQQLQKLPCGHSYCQDCLRIMIHQATTEESDMPPRCCTQPIPSSIIKSILSREEQAEFLKAVVQFSTPWEARVFCSNPSCGEFIPPRAKFDPKHPFKVVCRKCRTRVCVMCKKTAHPVGQDCPDDWELDAVLKIVWNPPVGCPNLCNGDEELERRRQEEAARRTALEVEEAIKQEAAAREEAEELEADERTRNCSEFKALREEQVKEMDRFEVFEQKSKWLLWARHARQKVALVGKHSASIEKMLERHTKTSANLEDRQVAAEMELRYTLEQSEKHVRVRLKHMEAYCDGLGHNPTPEMPTRVITEKDQRELRQQYNLEKNMKQLHQARINVMRDSQAKALEQLLERQECEVEKLREKNAKEVEHLELDFADEEDILATTFTARRSTLETRWKLEMEILRKELENQRGVRYSLLPPLEWPQGTEDKEAFEDGVAAVGE